MFPVRTLLLCGAAAVVFLAPALHSALIYDRAAIAGGEWWRLVTGNLVHHSLSHFIYDILAFLVIGTIIELRGYRHFVLLCLFAAGAIGLVLYLTLPEMGYYGGLSGVVTAALVYLCLNGLAETSPSRWLHLAVLAILAGKLGVEFALENSLTTYATPELFVPIPLSHGVGAVTALLVFLLATKLAYHESRR